jgi:hypothetical protein
MPTSFEKDPARNVTTFLAGSFSKLVGIALKIGLYGVFGLSADTGFRPAIDGWFIPNEGSYIRPRGNCLGMSCYAVWYHKYKKPATGTGLYEKYREGTTPQWRDEWRDDATAIQLATRLQLAAKKAFEDLWFDRRWSAPVGSKWNARYVAGTWLHGLIVEDEPQHITVGVQLANGDVPNMHALVVYGYSNGRFDIYDPNYPATMPGTPARQIPFTLADGFSDFYVDASQEEWQRGDTISSTQFNIFVTASSKSFYSNAFFKDLYEAAEKDFEDDTVFPIVQLTDETTMPEGETPIDTDGDSVRDTPEREVTISGTIKGGERAISSTLLYVNREKFKVDLLNEEFTKGVVLHGLENEIIVLATDEDTRTNWAGFLRFIINCTAPTRNITITLTVDPWTSTLQPHIIEPTIEGVPGRHVWPGWEFVNCCWPGEEGEHPCLAVHVCLRTVEYWYTYFGMEDMTLPNYHGPGKSLYGTYRVRVWYFDDLLSGWGEWGGDPDKPVEPAKWHLSVRYLAFRDEVTGREYWVEKSRRGTLTVEGETLVGEDVDFFSSHASWSPIWAIEYPEPDPADYLVQQPPQNMFGN